MKYNNIRAEMARYGLTINDLAAELDITETTLCYKLNDKKRFWLTEAKCIVAIFRGRGSDCTIESLFEIEYQ